MTKSNQTDQPDRPDVYTLDPQKSDLECVNNVQANFDEVQKHYDQAIKSFHEIYEIINITNQEIAKHVLQTIEDYKKIENKVKASRDLT